MPLEYQVLSGATEESSFRGPWLKRNWEKKVVCTHIFICFWFALLIECSDFVPKWIIWAFDVYIGGPTNPATSRWGSLEQYFATASKMAILVTIINLKQFAYYHKDVAELLHRLLIQKSLGIIQALAEGDKACIKPKELVTEELVIIRRFSAFMLGCITCSSAADLF